MNFVTGLAWALRNAFETPSHPLDKPFDAATEIAWLRGQITDLERLDREKLIEVVTRRKGSPPILDPESGFPLEVTVADLPTWWRLDNPGINAGVDNGWFHHQGLTSAISYPGQPHTGRTKCEICGAKLASTPLRYGSCHAGAQHGAQTLHRRLVCPNLTLREHRAAVHRLRLTEEEAT